MTRTPPAMFTQYGPTPSGVAAPLRSSRRAKPAASAASRNAPCQAVRAAWSPAWVGSSPPWPRPAAAPAPASSMRSMVGRSLRQDQRRSPVSRAQRS
ncbi:MAG TPA: hypothetical protein VFA46_22315 [Actinomycetes bacterium]|nr:hypothetical protein [Actinomycetes bacterium]